MMHWLSTWVIMLGLAIGPAAAAESMKIDLPPENAAYRPGANLELVNARCLICHSADYVSTQPSNLPRATWKAEVIKMKKVYGAPISEEDADLLVEYLTKTYGNERAE